MARISRRMSCRASSDENEPANCCALSRAAARDVERAATPAPACFVCYCIHSIFDMAETTWSNFPISEQLLKSLQEQNLEKPLPIQARALNATLIDDKNVLGAARTGSGKTLAYAIPIVNEIILRGRVSALLKQRIQRSHKTKQDFELVDGELISVEDMIVDNPKLENSDNESEVSVKSSESAVVEATCPEAIVLVPTRELAIQIKGEFVKLCSHTKIRSCCLIGGMNTDKQLRTLKKQKPEIIIATPGRLYDLVQSESVEHLNVASIASVRTLVVDEADRMIQKGHFAEMLKLIDMIKGSKGFRGDEYPYRVYLYSATLTFIHELPERLKLDPFTSRDSRSKGTKSSKKKSSIDPKSHNKDNKINLMLNLLGINRETTSIIDLGDESSFGRPTSNQLDEYRINCVTTEKDLNLYYFLLQNHGKRTLVFCNSKDCLRRLVNVLKYLKIDALKLHAEMDQKKRMSNLEKFRARSDSVLIATDVAARGLDIRDLDCVVHYQVPRTCESYIHRSGRTARVTNHGISLTLCEPKEVHLYRKLCNTINLGEDLKDYDINLDLRASLIFRVSLAQQCDKIDHDLRETESNKKWFVKAAKDCDIELDDEELRRLGGKGKSRQESIEDKANKRKHLAKLQKQLNAALKRPLRGQL